MPVDTTCDAHARKVYLMPVLGKCNLGGSAALSILYFLLCFLYYMDLSHDGTIVTCVQAGHTLFKWYLFRRPSLLGHCAKVHVSPSFRMAGKQWSFSPGDYLLTLPSWLVATQLGYNSHTSTRDLWAALRCFNSCFTIISATVSGFLLL